MGTQGHFWLLLFTGGFGAVLLYLAFFGSLFVRHLRTASPYVVLALSTVFMHLATMPFYNAVDPALFVTMIAVGLLWRVSQDTLAPGDPDRSEHGRATATPHGSAQVRALADPDLRSYQRLVRRHWRAITAAGLAGAALGGLLQSYEGTQVEVTQQVFVRDLENASSATGAELAAVAFSLDTEAQFARSDPVLTAIRTVAVPNMSQEELLKRVEITALPNTRILVIHIVLPRGSASDAVQAASTAYLLERSSIVNTTRLERMRTLDRRITSLTTTIQEADAVSAKYRTADSPALRRTISRLSNELRSAELARTRLANNPYDPGQVVGNPRVRVIDDSWFIKISSGLAIGLLLGAVLSWLLDGTRERVQRRSWRSARFSRSWRRARVASEAPPVLGRLRVPETALASVAVDDPVMSPAKMALTSYAPVCAVLPVGQGRGTRRVASLLDGWLLGGGTRGGAGGRVVLLVPATARLSAVQRASQRARGARQTVVGLIIMDEH